MKRASGTPDAGTRVCDHATTCARELRTLTRRRARAAHVLQHAALASDAQLELARANGDVRARVADLPLEHAQELERALDLRAQH
jgi:hypothetical protein